MALAVPGGIGSGAALITSDPLPELCGIAGIQPFFVSSVV
jgi:hypothetical protein